MKHKLVDKSGAWYAYNGDKIGQGKANSMKFLQENPAISSELEKRLRELLLTSNPVISTSEDSESEMPEDEEF